MRCRKPFGKTPETRTSAFVSISFFKSSFSARTPRTDVLGGKTDGAFDEWPKKTAIQMTKYQYQKILFVGFSPVPGIFKDWQYLQILSDKTLILGGVPYVFH